MYMAELPDIHDNEQKPYKAKGILVIESRPIIT